MNSELHGSVIRMTSSILRYWVLQHGGGSPLAGRAAGRLEPESGWARTAGRKEAKEGGR